MKKISYFLLLAVCCTVVFVYSSKSDVNRGVLHAGCQEEFQIHKYQVNDTCGDYQHEAVFLNIFPSVKLSSRNDTRNTTRFIKDKSFDTENLSTKQYVKRYQQQIVFCHIPQHLGLDILQRLNI